MATIAVVRATGQRAVVVGVGYGLYKSTMPSPILGNWGVTEDKGHESVIALSNERGELGWFNFHDVQIVEVDGKPIHSLLGGTAYR